MISPGNLYTYEPLDRTKLNAFTKVIVWFIEYFARVLGAIYISISILIVSVLPFRRMSKAFFRILGNVCDLYRARWMQDEGFGNIKEDK